MNSKNKLPESLEDRIKSCPVDFKKVEHLIQRAKKDLSSAKFIQNQDLEAAYQLLYDGMLHTALALMASCGLQPAIPGKHKTVIEYVRHTLGKEVETKIAFYDRMRRRRHQLIYEPGPYHCTAKEIEDARAVLQEFILLVAQTIKDKNPQKEFHFDA